MSYGSPEHKRFEEILENLIISAPNSALAKALRRVCSRDYDAGHKVVDHLTTEIASIPRGSRSADTQQCKGCGKEYKEEDNVEGVCDFYMWHPKEPSLDDDEDEEDDWADDDFPRLTASEPNAVLQNPRAFYYPCCEEKASVPGRKKHMHVPTSVEEPERPSQRKKVA